MNDLDYKRFYDRVGKANGWDFSKLKVISEGVLWDFNEEVNKKSHQSHILLDLGTGGGENVLAMASLFQFLVGIDLSSDMIETAQNNLKKSNISNVRFSNMSTNEIKFPAGFFDIITCRHAPFNAMEVAKVLKENGYFITQQVGENDKINLIETFNRGQGLGENGSMLTHYVEELNEAGFSKIEPFEYNAVEYYERPEDLIFLLRHTPIIPDFGEKAGDFEVLNDFMENNRTEKGIRTNSERFLIIAKK